jgi:Fur family peroxide stress response transcriptional regulator
MPEISEVLKKKGLKATPQRMAIYQALLSTDAHPGAEVIYEQLKMAYPTLSLNTVYTNLDILADVGLIRRIDSGEGLFRYDGNPSPHLHIICTDCRKVEDIYGDCSIDLADMTGKVEKWSGYKVNDHALYFFGQCPECLKR